MRRGEENNKVNNVLLRESILQSIVYLQSKVYLQEKEVYELVRAFFKEYLGLDYEFTHDELLIELQNVFYDKRVEDEVLEFLRKISRIEYSDDEIKPEELKKLLDDFSKIVETLIKKKSKGKSFLKKLIFWKEHTDEVIPADKQEEEEIAEVIEDMEKDVSVDKKKGLFGKDKKIPEHRIEKTAVQHKKTEPKPTPKTPPAEKKQELNKPKEEKEVKKPLNNSLLSLTQELNDHIEKNREYKQQQPKKSTEQSDKKPTQNVGLENSEKANPGLKKENKSEVKAGKEEPKTLKQLLKEMKKNPTGSLYKEIQNKYSQLPAEEQKKYYPKVMDAYNMIKKK